MNSPLSLCCNAPPKKTMKKCLMTDEQFERIKKASQPVPYMVFGGREPSSPQKNANEVWREIAAEHGVKWDTITPAGRDPKEFLAEEL